MALGSRFVCSGCSRAIAAWSDGNPYYLDADGTKQYAYHPDEEFARCIGNDAPHLCLGCGAECKVDSRAPIAACPTCGAAELADTNRLEARRCPFCKTGAFARDPSFHRVS